MRRLKELKPRKQIEDYLVPESLIYLRIVSQGATPLFVRRMEFYGPIESFHIYFQNTLLPEAPSNELQRR